MLIRYPYAKDVQIKNLKPWIANMSVSRKIFEPFAGTAAVTFYALNHELVDYYHINDADESIAALWLQVKNNSEELIERVRGYEPSGDDFYTFKSKAGKSEEDKAFRKIVLHQLSYNGLGAMSSAPFGDKGNEVKTNVDHKWNVEVIVDNIRECSKLLNSVEGKITSDNWNVCVDAGIKAKGFLYVDPPQYSNGHALYLESMTEHDVLARKLSQYNDWVVSYDNESEVRRLYEFASVNKLDTWSHLGKAPNSIDLVITPC